MPDQVTQTILDLGVTRYGRLAAIDWIYEDVVLLSMPFQLATGMRKLTQEFVALHSAMLRSFLLTGAGG